MNAETKIIFELFGRKWKGKYTVSWCDLCDTAIVSHEACGGTTCNAHAREECMADFNEFSKLKTTVVDYLTKEEALVYQKAMHIKKIMMDCFDRGESAIDWKKLKIRRPFITDG